jgi:hypothetical protein
VKKLRLWRNLALSAIVLALSACAAPKDAETPPSYAAATPTATPALPTLTPETPEPAVETPEEPRDDPRLLSYTLRARVRDDMPEYTFVVTGEWGDTSDAYAFATKIEAFDETSAVILSYDLETMMYAEMADTSGLHAADVNFDGFRDIIVLESFGGAHGNSWYHCWLWDEVSASFVYNESFGSICNPSIDREKQRVYSTGGSGAAYHAWHIFEFIDGNYAETSTLELMFSDYGAPSDSVRWDESALIDGEMTIIRNIVVPLSEYKVSELMTYTDPDGLWQLDNPRWYSVGGHDADIWLGE